LKLLKIKIKHTKTNTKNDLLHEEPKRGLIRTSQNQLRTGYVRRRCSLIRFVKIEISDCKTWIKLSGLKSNWCRFVRWL